MKIPKAPSAIAAYRESRMWRPPLDLVVAEPPGVADGFDGQSPLGTNRRDRAMDAGPIPVIADDLALWEELESFLEIGLDRFVGVIRVNVDDVRMDAVSSDLAHPLDGDRSYGNDSIPVLPAACQERLVQLSQQGPKFVLALVLRTPLPVIDRDDHCIGRIVFARALIVVQLTAL